MRITELPLGELQQNRALAHSCQGFKDDERKKLCSAVKKHARNREWRRAENVAHDWRRAFRAQVKPTTNAMLSQVSHRVAGKRIA